MALMGFIKIEYLLLVSNSNSKFSIKFEGYTIVNKRLKYTLNCKFKLLNMESIFITGISTLKNFLENN